MDPVVAAPSSATFRIALFALLGASVLALWLLVRPPGLPGENGGVVQQPDTTPDFTPGLTPDTGETLTPTGTAAAEPTATLIPDDQTPAPTPVPTRTPVPTPTPTPAPVQHVVVTGDSWNGIAQQFGVDPAALAAANGYSVADVLPNGITLTIPQ